MNRKWILPVSLLAFGAISAVWLFVVIAKINHVPEGMQAAPEPSILGIVQFLLSAISTGGFSVVGIITAIITLLNKNALQPQPVTPVLPVGPQPVTPVVPGPLNPPSGLLNQKDMLIADLVLAFPLWISDPKNPAKEMRFWFDLLQLGISDNDDAETQAWLAQGADILRRRRFPTPPASAIQPANQ